MTCPQKKDDDDPVGTVFLAAAVAMVAIPWLLCIVLAFGLVITGIIALIRAFI